jgi:hypothetical protein
VFFLALGRDEGEIDVVVSEAVSRGIIGTGDSVERLRWPGEVAPSSRWITSGGLTKAEDDVLMAEIERRMAERPPADRSEWTNYPFDQWSDEQLFARALGRTAA